MWSGACLAWGCSCPRVDEVTHDRLRPPREELPSPPFVLLVRMRDAPMLPEVLGPRTHVERLHEAIGSGAVAEESPLERAVAHALEPQLMHDRKKLSLVGRGNVVLDGDHHRPFVGLDLVRHRGVDPM